MIITHPICLPEIYAYLHARHALQGAGFPAMPPPLNTYHATVRSGVRQVMPDAAPWLPIISSLVNGGGIRAAQPSPGICPLLTGNP